MTHPNTQTLNDLNFDLFPNSLTTFGQHQYALASTPKGRKLLILTAANETSNFEVEDSTNLSSNQVFICPLTSKNAQELRKALSWLQPRVLGLQTSAGMGDRLGLATPGHVRALKKVGGKIAPIFAQQSIREMMRTHRSAQQVMDDATWGIFQEGWQQGVGADADHLKTFADIDTCLDAGFSFFTIDPGDHVNNISNETTVVEIRTIIDHLPARLALSENQLQDKNILLENLNLSFAENDLLQAMAKYGMAVWHVSQMYQYLVEKANGCEFELEVSVDETDLPTTHLEHYYIAHELKRLGVKWVSLAPRYVGRFEKGVDYIGDLAGFEESITGHAAIARAMGPYKLSLHSGSDKFSIYPLAMQHTRGLVHLKTAGTSYLEALYTLADVNLPLLKEIYTFARENYEQDRKSYHVSAQLANTPAADQVSDWKALITQFDAREVFHVTFGSVLTQKNEDGSTQFFEPLMETLQQHNEAYTQNLEKHFMCHLLPFSVSF